MSLKSVLMFFVFMLIGCSSEEAHQGPLKLAGTQYLGDLPTLVASKNHFFKTHGLNVEVTYHLSGKQGLEDLRAGKVDFALVAPTTFMLDKLANINVSRWENEPVILANLLHSTLMNQILTSKTDEHIQTVSDLSGGRIGLMRGTNAEYLWWLYSVFYQIDTKTVELIDLPISELGQALLHDEVDAIVAWQPWTNHFIAKYGDKFKQVEGSHVHSSKWLLVTSRQMAEENTEVCRQLLKAYADAISLIHSDTDTIMKMFTNEISQQAIIGQHYQPGLHQLNLNWSLIAELHQSIEWAKLNNVFGSEKTVDITSWFAPEPLRSIQPSLVKIPKLNPDKHHP